MADRNVRIVKANGKKPVIKYYPKKASTSFDKNSLVKFDGAGAVTPTADGDTVVLGIILKEVTASDSDYTQNTLVPVEVIMPGDEVEMDATASATVGVSYGVSNAYTVDVSDTTTKVATITKVISSTRVRCWMNGYAGGNVLG